MFEAQEGKIFYAGKEEFTCIGPMLLGMTDEDPVFFSGRVGPTPGVFKESRANRRIYQYLPMMPKNIIKYVAFSPVTGISFDPDLIIVMASISQAEIILRAKSYTTGEMWSARGTPVAGCSWLYIYPYLNGEMNMTITGFGFGMKSRQLFPEGRVLLSIPWDEIKNILDNLAEMNWVPHSYSIGGVEHKKKIKGIVEELKKEL